MPRADSCLTSAAERASTAPHVAREVIATDRLSLVWALRMSRFRGVQVVLPITRKNRNNIIGDADRNRR